MATKHAPAATVRRDRGATPAPGRGTGPRTVNWFTGHAGGIARRLGVALSLSAVALAPLELAGSGPAAPQGAPTSLNTENVANVIIATIGSRGTVVVAIQRKVGAYADGVYGPMTAAAVRSWQSRNRLTVTGSVDTVTYNKMFPVVPRVPVATTYRAGTQVIGYSVKGRPIYLTIKGSVTAARRAMFVGALHGNERGGVPVTKAMAAATPPAGVAYFVITLPNPDGAAYKTRQNARKVDLNRNFPGWRANGSPGYVCYSGTGPLSERESKVMSTAIRKIKPTLFVTYHQHLNTIDYGGGNKATHSTYAKQTRMRLVQLTRYPGSQATWVHAAYPKTEVMTVELPSYVPSTMVSRHLAAAKYIAAHH